MILRSRAVSMSGLAAAALVPTLLAALTGCGTGASSPTQSDAPPKRITTGSTSHVHVLQVMSGGRILLADQEGVWSGTSAGTKWRHTGPPLNHMMATCLAHTATVELACTTTYAPTFLGLPRGLWRTTDGGKRWVRSPLPDPSILYLAVNSALSGVAVAFARPDGLNGGVGKGGIWLTRNSGKSWRRINTSLAAAAVPIGLALLPGKPETVIFAEADGLHISHDGGKSWKLNSLRTSTVLCLTVSARNPSIAFACTVSLPSEHGAIWEGSAAGATWRKLWTGVPPASLLSSASDAVDDLYGYSGTGTPTIFRAHTAVKQGRTRFVITRETTPATSDQMVLAVDPGDPIRAYSAWSFPLRVFRSDDGGQKWRKLL